VHHLHIGYCPTLSELFCVGTSSSWWKNSTTSRTKSRSTSSFLCCWAVLYTGWAAAGFEDNQWAHANSMSIFERDASCIKRYKVQSITCWSMPSICLTSTWLTTSLAWNDDCLIASNEDAVKSILQQIKQGQSVSDYAKRLESMQSKSETITLLCAAACNKSCKTLWIYRYGDLTCCCANSCLHSSSYWTCHLHY